MASEQAVRAIDIRTTMGGYRYATAAGSRRRDHHRRSGPARGRLSERVKQQLRDWVNSSVYTRFNDPSQGALVLRWPSVRIPSAVQIDVISDGRK
jgi:hypothetical protein